MKIKTSITLESKLVEQIEKVRFESESRSAFFSEAVRKLITWREHVQRDASDARILTAVGSELNAEAVDNLTFVSDIFDDLVVDQP